MDITLERYRGPWPDDDPHAAFKAEVAAVGLVDPWPTLVALAGETGIPPGALARYVLARWAAEGSEALLAIGPRIVDRLAAVAAGARGGTAEARLAAFDALAGMLSWLHVPLEPERPLGGAAPPQTAPHPHTSTAAPASGVVRAASLADVEALAALVSGPLGYPVDVATMGLRLAGLLREPGWCLFVAEDHGAVVGVAAGALQPSLEHQGRPCRLTAMAVADGHQRRGIGSRLLAAVESWAIARGAPMLVLSSATHRDAGHRFYEARGYRRTGVRFRKAL